MLAVVAGNERVEVPGRGENDRSEVFGELGSFCWAENAFESMLERSYGFAVIRTEYKDDSSFDQEILIKPIANPDTVLITPYYKQPDASDITEGFILDLITKKQFKQK